MMCSSGKNMFLSLIHYFFSNIPIIFSNAIR